VNTTVAPLSTRSSTVPGCTRLAPASSAGTSSRRSGRRFSMVSCVESASLLPADAREALAPRHYHPHREHHAQPYPGRHGRREQHHAVSGSLARSRPVARVMCCITALRLCPRPGANGAILLQRSVVRYAKHGAWSIPGIARCAANHRRPRAGRPGRGAEYVTCIQPNHHATQCAWASVGAIWRLGQ